MKRNFAQLKANARAMNRDDLKSRYGSGKKVAPPGVGDAADNPDSQPVEGSEEEEAGETPDMEAGEGSPDGDEGASDPNDELGPPVDEGMPPIDGKADGGGDVAEITQALKSIPPDKLKAALMKLFTDEGGGDGGPGGSTGGGAGGGLSEY